MSEGIILFGVVLCIAVACAAIWLIRKLVPRAEALPVAADWIEELSVERYGPMLQLLDREESRKLSSQPGFTRRMAADLRRQRRQMFHGYLRSLRSDFSRVCLALKRVMLRADEDRSDLASLLIRSQVAFAWGMALVHVRLAFYAWGFGTVEVGDLLKLFGGLRVELRTLVPGTVAAT
jgi:hypothetical protein